jgi:abequosyltransferase
VEPLITIAIPTYNRAAKLERQLTWLADAVRGHEDECELVVSDNCSTDETARVIEDWRARMPDLWIRTHRQPKNIGAIRNIAWCISSAAGRFVWVVSDDDRIQQGALRLVINTLRRHDSLSLITLNFSTRDVGTGLVRKDVYYAFGDGVFHEDGRALFSRCLEKNWGGVALTTAQVYRTELARAGLASWPAGLDNLAVQVYWTGFCAIAGGALLTNDVVLECPIGGHFFSRVRRLHYQLQWLDLPEVYARLEGAGLSPAVSRRLLRARLMKSAPHLVLGIFRWPLLTSRGIVRLVRAVRCSSRSHRESRRHAADRTTRPTLTQASDQSYTRPTLRSR